MGVEPRLAFHGTDGANHASIFEKGLIVPGREGVSVANGSAHGVGIYTAKEPGLSFSFTRGTNKMLLCGVIDDCQVSPSTPPQDGVPAPTKATRWHRQTGKVGQKAALKRSPGRPRIPGGRVGPRMGRFELHAQSENVRHVGDAMVVCMPP